MASDDAPAPQSMASARNFWLLALALVGATVLAYLPALRGGLLIDDPDHVTRPALQSFAGLWRIWLGVGTTQQYFPVLHSAFWLEHRLWGDAVLGYHLTNVLLHAGSACLLVAVMRRLALRGAWLAGFIFALHPVCVESVAWISEQKNTLSTFFALGATLVFLRFDEARRPSSYAVGLGLFLLAVLSKSVAVTLPAVLLVVSWWERGRLEWKRDVIPLLPWFVLGALAVQPAAWMERRMCATHAADFSLSLLDRGLLAGRAFWFYLGKLIWPLDLVFMYPKWTIDPKAWWQYAFPLGALVLLGGLWLSARRNRGPLAAILIFTGTLFPALGFINVYWLALAYVGDHLQYLPCLAIIVLFSSGAARIASRMPAVLQPVALVMVVGLLATLGALTWHQSGMYRDAETLYRATLARNPGSWVAHCDLGTTLAQEGRLPDAIAQYEQAARIAPEDPDTQFNLGLAFKKQGQLVEAIGHYEQALRLKPDYADAHYNLGNALLQEGKLTDAIEHYQQAVRIAPGFADAQFTLGLALGKQGRLPEAIGHYEQALRLRPDYAEAHGNLGNALAQTGRLAEAMGHWEQALRLKPNYPEVQNDLAWLLATLAPADGGDPARAVTLAERACELTHNRAAEYLDTLAVAYASAGRFDDAIATARKAIELARSEGRLQLAGEIETRLELYRGGRPYRAPASGTSPQRQ
ncbi:MAG TPA: tetratricopeptide repeat protein [Verrucomicrobiae bacterium]|nr:tetratricopeptide repeat protein [Verrucomicrobiae bacterium]